MDEIVVKRQLTALKYALDDLKKADSGNTDKNRIYSVDKKKVAQTQIKNSLSILRRQFLQNPSLASAIDTVAESGSLEGVDSLIGNIRSLISDDSSSEFRLNAKIPNEIREEIFMDFNEMIKCYNSKCFRSAVILCARILEAALHRKYYDVTGKDILETNPEIGLGKLIAKLSEKNVHFAPGLTQQIHLLNKARIHSVHKKQEPFYPSDNQVKAIILLTTDVIEKLFGK